MAWLAAILLLAQEPQPLEAVVDRYAPLLQDPERRARAVDRLVHYGTPALERLASRGVDRETLDALRPAAELHDRLKDVYKPPRTFTFDGSEQELGTLLARLESGAGITFHRHQVDPVQKVSLSLEDASFWEALDALSRKTGLYCHGVMGTQVYLAPTPPPDRPRVFHGPLMIAVDRLTRQRRIGFDRRSDETHLRLACWWEGHVQPLGLSGRVLLARVVDDTGRSLLPDGPMSADGVVVPAYARQGWEAVEIRGLLPPAATARRLEAVEGSLELLFPVRVDVAAFDAPGGTTGSCAFEGLKVELRSCSSTTGADVAAEFALQFDDAAEAEAFRPNASDVAFETVGGRGPVPYLLSQKREGRTAIFAVRTHHLRDPADVRRLTLRLPRGRIVKPVPFLFEKVALR